MASRRVLIDRAFPDAPGQVQSWRRRIARHFAAAVTLAIVGLWIVGVLVLIAGVPVTVRYVRQQLALGALMAQDNRAAANAARLPDTDLRATRPLL